MGYIDKRISFKRLKDTLRWTHEAGIWTGLETICGFPYETQQDVELTAEFLNENRKHLDTVYYNVFYLENNSKIYLYPEKYGITNICDFDPQSHPEKELLNLLRYSFDEISGLKWKEKLDQSIKSYYYLYNNTNGDEYLFPYYEIEHFLFYLYKRFKNKASITEAFKKINKDFVKSIKDSSFGRREHKVMLP
ncbi:MAG: hypothetical protein LHV68_08050 [Elusimicrobia bacterium]|nr:hypothetical protein [Candidatus Liberimonas magnetica]